MRVDNSSAPLVGLPDEIKIEITKYLGPVAVHNLAMTCSTFKRVVADENNYWAKCGITPPLVLPPTFALRREVTEETTKSQVWMSQYNALNESNKKYVEKLDRPVDIHKEHLLSALPAGLRAPPDFDFETLLQAQALAPLPAGLRIDALNLSDASAD
jgi:hypothetical protein